MFQAEFFRGGGGLAELQGFEYRSEQESMAEIVWQVLESGHIGMIEAGTVTGKSMAYLYPAVCYAKEHKERVVISTNTINLQEQLIGNDIPVLQGMGFSFSAAVVKGWSNYPCWLRVSDALQSGDETSVRKQNLQQMLSAASQAESMSRSDFHYADAELWEDVQAEPDLCLRARCEYYDSCSFFLARKQAEEAEILIVNHHLLLADVSVRQAAGWEQMAVLPAYKHVIFDEAHHIDDVATSYFGCQISLMRVRRLLRLLARRSRSDRGAIPNIRRSVSRRVQDEPDQQELLQRIDWQVLPLLRTVEEQAVQFMDVLPVQEQKVTVAYGGFQEKRLLDGFDRLHSSLQTLAAELRRLLQGLEQHEAVFSKAERHFYGLRALTGRVEGLAADLQFLMDATDRDYVFWLERLPKSRAVVLAAAPVEVGPVLRESLLFQVASAVFTSATLTINRDFRFFQKSIGAFPEEEWDMLTAAFLSPFDLKEQVYLGVPTDLPYPSEESFAAALVDELEECLNITQGRAFVLFTSYSLLRRTAAQARERWSKDFTFLVQGEMPRTAMIQRFREQSRPVLFGTDSFWEGVDVPGKALSCVIVTKLPFRVPTDPVVAARAERIRDQGGSPFLEYFLPQAILKFRQGVGRLIRSRTDRGALFICDRRLLEKRYGKDFLEALPNCIMHNAPISQLTREVKKWFASS